MNLMIRKMETGDLEPLYELLSDPRVMRYLEPPYTKEQTEGFLESAVTEDPPPVYAVDKDGAFIGYVIFHEYDGAGMEIGWVLQPRCWGRGIASELTEILIKRVLSMGKQLVIECDPGQEATKRIARKYGFRYEGSEEGLDVFRLKA
ncbi:MAG: GNAT family N-acetyltransferase [Lachnospiraceae bacterium]|nr:GNAT family N-acetyltransferase [Lachnospiraceae bacterium]